MSGAQKVAAFFDLDGTLLPPPSLEWRFIGYLLSRDAIMSAHVRSWLSQFCKFVLRDPRAATVANKMYLAGLPESLATEWMASEPFGSFPLCADGIDCVAQHFARRHEVILLTGTLAPLARAVAAKLPRPVEICATELETAGGRWTGWVAGEHLSGAAKVRALGLIAERRGLDLKQCYAYGNEMADLPMLMSMGRPVAVNPSVWLLRCARRLGWQVCDWTRAQESRAAGEPPMLASKAGR
ncbi:MAG TPA: HAD family phosphatase [Candidatus Sulfotelmatobacter sp.]|nr:HAD family phosphatase [Candidatus Sulfotelmatobacter sp.]